MNEVKTPHPGTLPEGPEDDLLQLIRRCAGGDSFAQKALYGRYARMVKAVVCRYITNTQEGEEVFNDIFYRVFTKIHLYKPVGSFEGWLKTLAVNTILNSLKTKLRPRAIAVAHVEEEVFISPEILGKLERDALLRMVQDLPEIQRTVFNLYVFEGFRHKEIAEMLGFKEINSKWHLNSARQKLKKQINIVMSHE